jgi:Single Cache domain 2
MKQGALCGGDVRGLCSVNRVFDSRRWCYTIVAGPVYVRSGTDVRTLKDSTGKAYGQESYAAAQKPEGQITELSYMAPKPGTTAPVFPKVNFVTRVGDLNCGVGYFIR